MVYQGICNHKYIYPHLHTNTRSGLLLEGLVLVALLSVLLSLELDLVVNLEGGLDLGVVRRIVLGL